MIFKMKVIHKTDPHVMNCLNTLALKIVFRPQNAVYLVWINTMHIDKRFVYGPAQVNVNLERSCRGKLNNEIMYCRM